MPLLQDVCYYFDDKRRICVDMCAKALDIADVNNPDCWKYEIVQNPQGVRVYHAILLRDTRLEVKGQHSQVQNLTPMTQYKVYFDVQLMHDAKGFNHPIMFEFSDQSGNLNRKELKLNPGNTKLLVGQFISTPGSQNITAKMCDFNDQVKSGLLVRCVSILPADD